jgi:hypothetical protein
MGFWFQSTGIDSGWLNKKSHWLKVHCRACRIDRELIKELEEGQYTENITKQEVLLLRYDSHHGLKMELLLALNEHWALIPLLVLPILLNIRSLNRNEFQPSLLFCINNCSGKSLTKASSQQRPGNLPMSWLLEYRRNFWNLTRFHNELLLSRVS